MSLTVGSPVARMIPEEPGEDPGEWPELQSAPVNKNKVRWGQGVQSEEEAYLGKLESKLATIKNRGAVTSPPPRNPPKEDIFDTSFSLASSPSVSEYDDRENSEDEVQEEEDLNETNVEAIEADNPGLPLLWDQPPVECTTPEEVQEVKEMLDVVPTDRSLPVTPERSRSLVIRHSSDRPGLASNDSKVRFFGRVRVTSGRRAVSSQYRQRSPRGMTPPTMAPKSYESSSIASSVTMSLRGTPTTSWLFPTMTPIGTPSTEGHAPDYFSYTSPSSSSRRSGTMTPRDPEVEEVAARAARARALTWAPNRRTSSSDPHRMARRTDSDGNIMLKTEDGVIWGSWRTRLTTMKWWTWKARRVWYAIQRFWCHADDDDDENDEERRLFARE
ncbi:hypothetical protein NliqN6_0102 [Naganishia liquefaciens]|uniref:Uncharacterized protein n=1 Tax=Naganishia liquefaciens TaxID=104408 RepID=A0A8H3TNP7_9TREE|nr:hypothetical protein NliqN6_0102 [Naganishia liquefaciens]